MEYVLDTLLDSIGEDRKFKEFELEDESEED